MFQKLYAYCKIVICLVEKEIGFVRKPDIYVKYSLVEHKFATLKLSSAL